MNSKEDINKTNNIKKKSKIINQKNIIILCCIVISIAITATLARYVLEELREYYLKSHNFYFNSDLIVNENKYEIYNWNTIDTYTIPIKLFNSEDIKRWTQNDIEYTVQIIENDSKVNLTHNASGLLKTNPNEPTIDTFYLTIDHNTEVPYTQGDVIPIKVIISSTSEYKKTLEATFQIHISNIGIGYTIIDEEGKPYFLLNITNVLETDEEMFLDWNYNDISIDNLNNIVSMSDKGIINSEEGNNIHDIRVIVPGKTTISIKFYKNDPNNIYDTIINDPFAR